MSAYRLAPHRAMIALIALTLSSAPAWGDSLFSFRDQNGRKTTQTAANSVFRISEDSEGVSIEIDENAGTARDWTAVFRPPVGQTLAIGRYYGIECEKSPSGRAPGMEVRNLNSKSCGALASGDPVSGWFGVRQIVRDAQGTLTGIEIVFSQDVQTGLSRASMDGVIRHGVQPLAFTVGDKLGNAGYLDKDYQGDTSLFGMSGTNEGLEFTVSGRRDDATVKIQPPAGQRLNVGTYWLGSGQNSHKVELIRSNNNDADRSCLSAFGTLQIKALKTDAAGNVTGLSANFEQACRGLTTFKVRGSIRYRF